MSERNYAIDFIRLVAILGVVVIHVSTAFIDRVSPFTYDFYFYTLINQLTRFSVPLFFLISGFLLASKYQTISSPITFYKKRLYKILIPYIFWSIFYFIFIFKNTPGEVFSGKFANDLYTGGASYQLYFIPAIIVLYLLFPLIIYLKKYLINKWFIVLLVIFMSILLTNTYIQNANIPLHTPFRIALYNLLPFIIGIYSAIKITNLNNFVKKFLTPLIFAATISAIIIFAESIYMFAKTNIGDYIRNQWRISVLIYGISFAPLLYYFYEEHLIEFKNSIYHFSTFALGVFFVHVAILTYVLEVVDNLNFYNPISFLLSLTTVVVLSFAFSMILSKIGFINKFLGLRG